MTIIKTQTSDKEAITEVCAVNNTEVTFHGVTDELMFVEIDEDSPSTLWYMARLVESKVYAKQIREMIV